MGDGVRLVRHRQVTCGPGTHEHPVFSPDGRRIAWYAGTYGWLQIHVANADGSGARPLTCGRGNHTQPAWSPDGRHVWFRAQPGNAAPWGLWRVAPDDPTDVGCALSRGRASFKHPSPSPDGRTLAWFSDEGSPANFHLWTAPLARGRLGRRTRITDSKDRNDCHPTWSPDGRRLAFHAYMGRVEADESDVFLCDRDGGSLERLTSGRAMHKHPFFVGSALVVHHTEDRDGRRLALREAREEGRSWDLTSGRHSDKHPSPWVPPRGPVRIAFSTRKRGAEMPDDPEPGHQVFWAVLSGVPVPR